MIIGNFIQKTIITYTNIELEITVPQMDMVKKIRVSTDIYGTLKITSTGAKPWASACISFVRT